MMRYRNLADTPMNRRRARSHVGGLDDASTHDDSTHDGLKAQHRITKREVSDLQRKWKEDVPATPPLIFHWSGPVADLLDMRAGPDWFTAEGELDRIDYRFDTAAAVTVEWYLDGSASPFTTHTLSADGTETLSQAYDGEHIIAIVTADAGAAGLTARVYQR